MGLLENKYPTPKYIGKIKNLEFSKLKQGIDNKNENYIKKLIRDMYVNNQAYILKNCAQKSKKNSY